MITNTIKAVNDTSVSCRLGYSYSVGVSHEPVFNWMASDLAGVSQTSLKSYFVNFECYNAAVTLRKRKNIRF